MILVDKQIKDLVNEKKLIIADYNEANLNGVSYDLTIDCIYGPDREQRASYELAPGETVFIKTKEKLSIPRNILGRIAEKNSRMRMGLRVDGPHYQPGHVSYAFLRVQNISSNIIVVNNNDKIAQIMFEQLSDEPDVTYAEQKESSFQDEVNYVGFGKYQDEFSKQIKSFQTVKEDVENMSQKIYGNVLIFMGIIVAVFSLLSINYHAFTNAELDFKYIVAMNLSLTFCIAVLMGIILIFINNSKKKGFVITYAVILVILAIATIWFSLCIF